MFSALMGATISDTAHFIGGGAQHLPNPLVIVEYLAVPADAEQVPVDPEALTDRHTVCCVLASTSLHDSPDPDRVEGIRLPSSELDAVLVLHGSVQPEPVHGHHVEDMIRACDGPMIEVPPGVDRE